MNQAINSFAVFLQLFSRPMFDSVLSRELYQAKRDYLDARSLAEHYSCISSMLAQRIIRLEMSQKEEKVKERMRNEK